MGFTVRHGVPNVHIEETEEDLGTKFAPPKDFGVSLLSTSLKDQKVALHRYFSQHIGKLYGWGKLSPSSFTFAAGQLWGLKAIPWASDLTKYFRGAPDRLAYSPTRPLYNSKNERVRQYLPLLNPLTQMSKEDAEVWFKHIIASEKGEIPEDEALCFIGAGNETFSVHGARKKGATEVGDADADDDSNKRPRKRKRPSAEAKPRKDKKKPKPKSKSKPKRRICSETESEAQWTDGPPSDDDDDDVARSVTSENFEAELAELDSLDEDDELDDDGLFTPQTEEAKKAAAERAEKKAAKEAKRQAVLARLAEYRKSKEQSQEEETAASRSPPSDEGAQLSGSAPPLRASTAPDQAPAAPLDSLEGKDYKKFLNEQLTSEDFNAGQIQPASKDLNADPVRPPVDDFNAGPPSPPPQPLNLPSTAISPSSFPACELQIPPTSFLPPYPPSNAFQGDPNVRIRQSLQPLSKLPTGSLPSTFFNYPGTENAHSLLEAFLCDEERFYYVRMLHRPRKCPLNSRFFCRLLPLQRFRWTSTRQSWTLRT